MHRIDVLAYKFDVDSTDSFNEDVISYSSNSIILNWNANKIWVQYKPENIKLEKMAINFFQINNQRWRYYFSPFIYIVYIIQIFKLFIGICWKFRPKVFIVENYVEGMVAGIIRRIKLVDKSIYLPGDWFAGRNYNRLFSNIANNLLFPYIDYLACRFNDIVVDREGGKITESRNKYWGKIILTTEQQFIQRPRIKTTDIGIDKKRTNICFIGEIREDSGLDIAIKSLSRIRMHLDANLIVIGSKRLRYENFVKLAQSQGVNRYVKFLGFVERRDFGKVLADCFCGINIINIMNSYSSQSIPSKIMYYFQYLLPVIVTEGVYSLVVSVIQEHRLGLVIRPHEEEFIEAILKIYSEQEQYRSNIRNYMENFPEISILEFLSELNV